MPYARLSAALLQTSSYLPFLLPKFVTLCVCSLAPLCVKTAAVTGIHVSCTSSPAFPPPPFRHAFGFWFDRTGTVWWMDGLDGDCNLPALTWATQHRLNIFLAHPSLCITRARDRRPSSWATNWDIPSHHTVGGTFCETGRVNGGMEVAWLACDLSQHAYPHSSLICLFTHYM